MASLVATPVPYPEPPDPGIDVAPPPAMLLAAQVITFLRSVRLLRPSRSLTSPVESPNPLDKALSDVFSGSRLLFGSSTSVSNPYMRLVFLDRAAGDSALDSHFSNGTSLVFVALNKLGLCSTSPASPLSERFGMFIESEAWILLDPSVSDSFTAPCSLVQIYRTICSPCFIVNVERLNLARFGICSMFLLSQVSRSLRYSTHEKFIGLASLCCLNWEPIDYTSSTVARSLILGKYGSFLLPIAFFAILYLQYACFCQRVSP